MVISSLYLLRPEDFTSKRLNLVIRHRNCGRSDVEMVCPSNRFGVVDIWMLIGALVMYTK